MKTLTKADIVNHIMLTFDLERKEAKSIVEFFFEEIKLALEQGETVKLAGFGNFLVKDKKARPGRNPKTGEPALISARKVVSFTAGQKLRQQVEARLCKKSK